MLGQAANLLNSLCGDVGLEINGPSQYGRCAYGELWTHSQIGTCCWHTMAAANNGGGAGLFHGCETEASDVWCPFPCWQNSTPGQVTEIISQPTCSCYFGWPTMRRCWQTASAPPPVHQTDKWWVILLGRGVKHVHPLQRWVSTGKSPQNTRGGVCLQNKIRKTMQYWKRMNKRSCALGLFSLLSGRQFATSTKKNSWTSTWSNILFSVYFWKTITFLL